jgi:hypothetical protein
VFSSTNFLLSSYVLCFTNPLRIRSQFFVKTSKKPRLNAKCNFLNGQPANKLVGKPPKSGIPCQRQFFISGRYPFPNLKTLVETRLWTLIQFQHWRRLGYRPPRPPPRVLPPPPPRVLPPPPRVLPPPPRVLPPPPRVLPPR